MEKKVKPLLAYCGHDGDEGWAIVFARSGAEARRLAAREMNVEWEDVEWCRRRKDLDRYAPGPVPLEALVETGWWFECSGCYQWVDKETKSAAYIGSEVYCSPWCYHDHLAERARNKAVLEAELDRLEAHVISNFPGAALSPREKHRAYVRTSLYGSIVRLDAEVRFRFPGGEFEASYRDTFPVDKHANGLRVCYGDLDAWSTYIAGTKERREM